MVSYLNDNYLRDSEYFRQELMDSLSGTTPDSIPDSTDANPDPMAGKWASTWATSTASGNSYGNSVSPNDAKANKDLLVDLNLIEDFLSDDQFLVSKTGIKIPKSLIVGLDKKAFRKFILLRLEKLRQKLNEDLNAKIALAKLLKE